MATIILRLPTVIKRTGLSRSSILGINNVHSHTATDKRGTSRPR